MRFKFNHLTLSTAPAYRPSKRRGRQAARADPTRRHAKCRAPRRTRNDPNRGNDMSFHPQILRKTQKVYGSEPWAGWSWVGALHGRPPCRLLCNGLCLGFSVPMPPCLLPPTDPCRVRRSGKCIRISVAGKSDVQVSGPPAGHTYPTRFVRSHLPVRTRRGGLQFVPPFSGQHGGCPSGAGETRALGGRAPSRPENERRT